jgi:hypothetical protein
MRIAIAAALLGLCGCATIVNGTHTDVAIRSEPAGASFELRDQEGAVVASGETPATVNVSRSRGPWKPARYELTLAKPGYLPKRTPLTTRLGALGFIDWLLFVPSLVDYTVGSSWEIEEPPVQILSPDIPFQRP